LQGAQQGLLSQPNANDYLTRAGVPAPPAPPTAADIAALQYSQEKDLNTRYRKELAGFAGVQGAVRDVMELTRGNSALQTEAAIIKLAKALDPGSVVRAGETAAIKATQSIPQYMATAMNQLLKGGAGDPELLKAIQATAADIYKTSVIPAQMQLQQFKELAQMYPNVRPEAIATGLGINWKYSPQVGGLSAGGSPGETKPNPAGPRPKVDSFGNPTN